MTDQAPIRVLVVDDQELVRAGFVALLEATDGLEVVGAAGDGASAVQLFQQAAPDVVLMDIRMPGLDGVSATRQILQADRDARIIVLTTFDADEHVLAALDAGAVGFLVKDTPPVLLLAAVRTAATGGWVISPGTARRLTALAVGARAGAGKTGGRPGTGHSGGGGPHPGRDALAGLTPRERDVLTQLGLGRSNREIADELVISELTAKTHVSRLLTKLGLASRVQAAILAREAGLVGPPR